MKRLLKRGVVYPNNGKGLMVPQITARDPSKLVTTDLATSLLLLVLFTIFPRLLQLPHNHQALLNQPPIHLILFCCMLI